MKYGLIKPFAVPSSAVAVGNADDSVHPTARHHSAGNIWWQFIHSCMRKGGDKVLHEFSMPTWQPPLIKMATVWG